MIEIEVVYAGIDSYQEIALQVSEGVTIEQAIRQSGIQQLFPEISLKINRVGIFGQLKALHSPVSAGDRLEIYRPLNQSAMALRKMKAAKQRQKSLKDRG